MGVRTDGALAVVVLTAALVAFVLVGATPSLPAFLLGAAATLGFELVAARDPETVRKYWERRPVQFAAVVVALVIVESARRSHRRACCRRFRERWWRISPF